ncbi:MAG: DUF5343 domain-containing protein [Caldimonas sp.]
MFNLDFLKDLGFASSQDRSVPKLLKYLGMLDDSGRPLAPYREFMDHTEAKQILAGRMRVAFDDLFTSDKSANNKTADQLKGWFKTKTGAGDAVAKKIASTFRSLATYADFNAAPLDADVKVDSTGESDGTSLRDEANDRTKATTDTAAAAAASRAAAGGALKSQFGLVYRFEIHLPDTQNVDAYRAIFRALREELM